MPGRNDEPPINDGLRGLLTRAGFVHSTNAWVQMRAEEATSIPANDDEAVKGESAMSPRTVASAAAQDPDDKRTQDAKYRAKERAEDARRGIAQCVLRLPRPLHPPLQAVAAEAREPGGSRTVVAIAALSMRPEWRELIYNGELHADCGTLIAALSTIVTNTALRRLVCALATTVTGDGEQEPAEVEAVALHLLKEPVLRRALLDPRIRSLCLAIVTDERATDLIHRVLADTDRSFLDAATCLPQPTAC